MTKLPKILSIRIKILVISLLLVGCAASGDRRATEDVGPVTAYARNTLAQENPQGLVRIGEGFERARDYLGARQLYAQAMAAAPDLVDAKIAYARVSSTLGQSDEATAVLTLLLREKPNSRLAKTTLAQVHTAAGRYDAALKVLEALPEPAGRELMLIGQLLHVTGDGVKGQARLTEALDMSPRDAVVLEAAALSFALNGDYPASVGLLRRAMDQRSASETAQKSLAMVYALSGQRQAALRLARNVMSVNEVQRLEAFYRFLPRFSKQEQAAALFFNRVPTDTVKRLSGDATN